MSKQGKEVRNLLSVLIAGILSAVIVVVGMMYWYYPNGHYKLKNVLLSPDLSQSLKYFENNSEYLFERFEFVWFEDGEWKNREVSKEQYQKFYSQFGNLESTEKLSESVKNQFETSTPATFSVVVRSNVQDQAFQEVMFLEKGDIFRVELHDESANERWAYFISPGIYKKVLNILR